MKRGRRWIWGTLILLVIAGCRQAAIPAPPLAEQLDAHLPQLEQRLAELQAAEVPDPIAQLIDRQADALERARSSEDALVELYRLREPLAGIHALAFFTDHQPEVDSMEELETVWRSSANLFVKGRALPRNRLQRAMIQAAENRASVLREASLAYGKIASPPNGLYYLGEAVGQAELASFLRSIQMDADPADQAALSETAVARGLDEVDRQALAIFESAPTEGTAIPVSARLKEARELLDRGEVDGAALVLLESRLVAALQSAESQLPGDRALPSSARDSIADLLIRLAKDDEERKPVIAGALLPFYDTLLQTNVAEMPSTSTAPVVVTLVRWPYT